MPPGGGRRTQHGSIRRITRPLLSRRRRRKRRALSINYTGNAIPWYVRLIWIMFWCGAIAYVVTWLLPALQTELLAPSMTTESRPASLRLLQAASARGLVGPRPAARRGRDRAVVYCCLGCRIAAAIVDEKSDGRSSRGPCSPVSACPSSSR